MSALFLHWRASHSFCGIAKVVNFLLLPNII
jgi:hypothetical protein